MTDTEKIFHVTDNLGKTHEVTQKMLNDLTSPSKTIDPEILSFMLAWFEAFTAAVKAHIEDPHQQNNAVLALTRNKLSSSIVELVDAKIAAGTIANADLVLVEFVDHLKQIHNRYMEYSARAGLADFMKVKPKITKTKHGDKKITINLLRGN